MGGWEKEDKECAKDEDEEENAEERAVKEAGKRPTWKESGHEGEERELSSILIADCQLGFVTAPLHLRPEKGTPCETHLH